MPEPDMVGIVPNSGNEIPILDLLRCPLTGSALIQQGDVLHSIDRKTSYRVNEYGVPLFAESALSDDAEIQREHYEKIAEAYVTNLSYPHTQEYAAYLDRALLGVVKGQQLGTIAELCCGQGESFKLLLGRYARGVGADITESMLQVAVERNYANAAFIQADVTKLPLADAQFDNVFMLGGIHHINERISLFREIHRILKPRGRFYFREPADDFFLWRWLRWIIYRIAPALDHTTEHPLRREQTIASLEQSGLVCREYRTHGFLGFCFLMNSDVLVFNRLFRFLPGIRAVTRLATRFDAWMLRLPGMQFAGLQVVGVAEKPGEQAGSQIGLGTDERWSTGERDSS